MVHQVIINFRATAQPGQWELKLQVPRGVGMKDVHKAFLMLASQIGENLIPDTAAPLIEVAPTMPAVNGNPFLQ